MPPLMKRGLRKIGQATEAARDFVIGHAAVAILKGVRRTDPRRMSDRMARLLRWIGPKLREHRIGRDNLRHAFPDKSGAEIERILLGVWDNLGRLVAEFAHLDRIWDHDPARTDRMGDSNVEFSQETIERFVRLRDDGKPALVFAAHLANWELPALPGPAHGLPSAAIYRPPNLKAAAQAILEVRSLAMGELISRGIDAPLKVADALERGLHVGMLVDQYNVQGVEVTFFGRRTKANPMLARLARHFDCPIHGTRAIRLPGNRFRLELTEEIPPARLADGSIDVAGTMQRITDVVEGWIREYPEQWLWLHRRWR